MRGYLAYKASGKINNKNIRAESDIAKHEFVQANLFALDGLALIVYWKRTSKICKLGKVDDRIQTS